MPPSSQRHPRIETAPLRLRLLGTSDLHAQLLPYDYLGDRHVPELGLSPIAAQIRQARAEAANCLLFDAGDTLQGTPFADHVASLPPAARPHPHPMIAALNAMGVDAATPGNHDFDFGLDFLSYAFGAACFPVVSANTRRATGADARSFLPPFALLERDLTDENGARHRLKIGVIGFLPPQVVQWDHAQVAGQITSRDIPEAAQVHLPAMRAAGADIIVALCHSGFGPPEPPTGAENTALGLARQGGIDAMICGHAHRVFPSDGFREHPGLDPDAGTAAGIPAVMPGANGSHLGVIDLTLVRTATGWQVRASKVGVRAIAARVSGQRLPPDGSGRAVFGADTYRLHAETVSLMRTPIGHARKPFSSHFAAVSPCPCACLVAHAQVQALRAPLAEAGLGHLPLLSAASSFRTGGRGGPAHFTEIPAGPLRMRHLADLVPFPNQLCVLRLTGAELRAWLAHAASVFDRALPGPAGQALLSGRMPFYDHDLVLGVTYAIDLSAEPGSDRRITDLRKDGRPLRDTDLFLLATSDYRANGGGRYPGAARAPVVLNTGQQVRQVLHRYLEQQRDLDPTPPEVWTLRALPGTCVRFATSPGAGRFSPAPPGLALRRGPRCADGFQLYELSF